MRYYKVKDGEIIGVSTTYDLRRYQEKHNLFLACDESKCQYIECNDNLYRAEWMLPETVKFPQFKTVEVIEIDESEYNIFAKASEVIFIENEEEPPIEEPDVYDDELEFVRNAKLSEISRACSDCIVGGFDVDGHHYSLTVQDQLNLITLSTLDRDSIPYHADGEECRFYTKQELSEIINMAMEHKTYHLSYHNALKLYVESLGTKEEIYSVHYGIEVPVEFRNEVLLTL